MTTLFSNFLPIWEVEHHFKCPVIGTLLSEAQHRNILKKCGYQVKGFKPYEHHRLIMENLNDANTLSVKVNNFLIHQSRKHMTAVDGASEKEIRAMWKKEIKEGNPGPLMFAIIACRDSSPDLLADVSGEIHMLTHANMRAVFKVRTQLQDSQRQLSQEKKKTREKAQQIKSMIRRGKKRDGAMGKLEQENRALQLKVRELENRVPDHGADNQSQMEIEQLKSQRRAAEQENQQLTREMKAIQIDLFSAQNEVELLKKELREIVAQFHQPLPEFEGPENADNYPCETCGKDCDPQSCTCPRLCAKRIFMIGGITKMKAHYKDIVESAGGYFEYHDGYLKNTNANLEAKVRRSDLVICPVNCNSHSACLRVKKLCNQYNKELKILNSSSLSALTRAVFHAAPEDSAPTPS